MNSNKKRILGTMMLQCGDCIRQRIARVAGYENKEISMSLFDVSHSPPPAPPEVSVSFKIVRRGRMFGDLHAIRKT
jgi:hypothetical protein